MSKKALRTDKFRTREDALAYLEDILENERYRKVDLFEIRKAVEDISKGADAEEFHIRISLKTFEGKTSGGDSYYDIPYEVIQVSRKEQIQHVKLLILSFIEYKVGESFAQICMRRFTNYSLSPEYNPSENRVETRGIPDYWLPKLREYRWIVKHLIKEGLIEEDLHPRVDFEQIRIFIKNEFVRLANKDGMHNEVLIGKAFADSQLYTVKELELAAKASRIPIPGNYRELNVYEHRALLALASLADQGGKVIIGSKGISKTNFHKACGATLTAFSREIGEHQRLHDALVSLSEASIPIIRRSSTGRAKTKVRFISPLNLESKNRQTIVRLDNCITMMPTYRVIPGGLNQLEEAVRAVRGRRAKLTNKDVLFLYHLVAFPKADIEPKALFALLRFKENSTKDRKFVENKYTELCHIRRLLYSS